MNEQLLISVEDYKQIYECIFSVLDSTNNVTTHSSCLFFAAAGALILQKHYGLTPSITAGLMALVIDDENPEFPNTIVYGRRENGRFLSDEDGFHAWVECDGWHIDFMAPLFSSAYRAAAQNRHVPNKMMQMKKTEMKQSVFELKQSGDLHAVGDANLCEALLDRQDDAFSARLVAVMKKFVRPPVRLVVLSAPSFNGAW